MSTHRRLALRIINELMPSGNASNLRLTICKLMHASGDCSAQLSTKPSAYNPQANSDSAALSSQSSLVPCERVFIAVVRATISAFKIGCASNARACEQFMQQLQFTGMDEQEQQMLAREIDNPTPPRGIAKIDISEEASVVVFLLTAYIVMKNGQIKAAYLRELAEALDINSLLAERLIQTAKHSINERKLVATRRMGTSSDELMLA